MAGAQFRRIEAGAGGGARREVLHEDVGARQDAAQKRRVGRVLDIENERFLAAVEPQEIGAPAMRDVVVAAGEVALLALDLDDPRAGIGEARGAERRGDRLFERDHQHAGQCLSHSGG